MGNCVGAEAKPAAAKKPAEPAPAPAPKPAVAAPAPPAAEVPAASTPPPAPAEPAPAEPAAASEAPAATPPPAEAAAAPAATQKPKIYVIYYSTYGHVKHLAETFAEAVNAAGESEAIVYQVPETLPADVLEKMHAPPKGDHPSITASMLPDADGIAFGFPTRFGMMCAQMKAFFDTTGGLWQSGGLAGKPATMFTSTATQGGGQETTLLTTVTQLAHHGMLCVPPGYAAQGAMFGVEKAKGGGPFGAGTLAGPDGSRMPSEEELEALKVQAIHFGKVVKKLKA